LTMGTSRGRTSGSTTSPFSASRGLLMMSSAKCKSVDWWGHTMEREGRGREWKVMVMYYLRRMSESHWTGGGSRSESL
jgi:hypothetical protein